MQPRRLNPGKRIPEQEGGETQEAVKGGGHGGGVSAKRAAGLCAGSEATGGIGIAPAVEGGSLQGVRRFSQPMPMRSFKRVPVTEARQPGTIAPGQPLPAARSKAKFVPLPNEGIPEVPSSEDLFRYPLEDYPSRGYINAWCIANALNFEQLKPLLEDRFGKDRFSEVAETIVCQYTTEHGQHVGDVYYFIFGVVVCWGLSSAMEFEAVYGLAGQTAEGAFDDTDVEVDEFAFIYSFEEQPHIQNDTMRLNHKFARDHMMKIAISLAIAQSTKLSVQEELVLMLVDETKHYPYQLAETGTVPVKEEAIAQMIGRVFLQKSAVNLLSTVMAKPEFFRLQKPDHLQEVYKSVCQYVELEHRVAVLNARYEVLMEMLDMMRDHYSNAHAIRLEWIVIVLIFISMMLGVFQVASLLGVFSSWSHSGAGSSAPPQPALCVPMNSPA